MAEARVSFLIRTRIRARARAKARARARARASAMVWARTYLELGLVLVRFNCII